MSVDTTIRAAADHGCQVRPAAGACAATDLAPDGETIPAETVRKAFIAAPDGAFATII